MSLTSSLSLVVSLLIEEEELSLVPKIHQPLDDDDDFVSLLALAIFLLISFLHLSTWASIYPVRSASAAFYSSLKLSSLAKEALCSTSSSPILA
jgi:hypothetical protein